MIYYSFCVSNTQEEDLLVGLLSQWPFEGFMSTGDEFCAYLPASEYSVTLEHNIKGKMAELGFEIKVQVIEEQNWNQVWEKNFEPVVIGNFCCIRADFHDVFEETEYTIIINPKMAFGTGHHETTWMMIQAMQHFPIEGKRVFDIGMGTGILAILASQMGADHVDGIDYDINAVENAFENAQINGIHNAVFQQAELNEFGFDESYDIVLANINFPVLLEEAGKLVHFVKEGGVLLLSGVLLKQVDQLLKRYIEVGFEYSEMQKKGDWACIQLTKSK